MSEWQPKIGEECEWYDPDSYVEPLKVIPCGFDSSRGWWIFWNNGNYEGVERKFLREIRKKHAKAPWKPTIGEPCLNMMGGSAQVTPLYYSEKYTQWVVDTGAGLDELGEEFLRPMPSEPKILPCPHCGSEASVHYSLDWYVQCRKFCQNSVSKKEEAIRRWNQRVPGSEP